MTSLPPSRSGKSALEIAALAAQRAGEVLLAQFRQPQETRRKGRGNLVTDADLLSEKAMADLLQGEYPTFNLLSEETKHAPLPSPYTWVIDPLDGTNNYAFGVPFFSVTVALLKGEEVLLGLTYDPLRKELFLAEKGRGAYLNGSPISVSSKKRIEECFIGYDLGYEEKQGRDALKIALSLWPRLHSLRVMGSGALGMAYVACGRFDLYFHRCLYPWDFASASLLVPEAGGIITDWEGKSLTLESRQLVASHNPIYEQFLEIAKKQ